MQTGGKHITEIRRYTCGSCSSKLNHIFKHVAHEKREFPATALLFKHNDDYYLVDTGYSQRVLEYGWQSNIYNKIIPVKFDKKDGLKYQLIRDGIDIKQVKGIFLTHLHPDHIGGLRAFSDIDIFLSQAAYETYKKAKLFDLIFKNLLPDDFEERVIRLDITRDIDFFSDGSLILMDVSGHTKGQMGLLFQEDKLFYAADASWGMDLIDNTLKLSARFLQKDMIAYKQTREKIKKMQASGIKVSVSHDIAL